MIRHGRVIGACVALTVCLAVSSPAQIGPGYTIKAYVEPSANIDDSSTFRYVIQVDGGGSPAVIPPRFPGVDGLSVLGGPNTSSNFVFRNGRASSSYRIFWTLLASKPGKLEIPALTFQVDGQEYTVDSVPVPVQASGGGDPGAAGSATAKRPGTNEGVFLRAELGAKDIWVGQTVPLDVSIFTTRRVTRPMWVEQPDLADFWVEKVEVNSDLEAYQRRIGQRLFTVYPLDRRLLIPPAAGEFTIEPFVAQMQARGTRSSPLDAFSFGRSQTIVRRTEPLKIRVRSLPTGAPDDFSGAVGSFQLEVTLDRQQAAVNDAVSLRAVVRGEGSLRAVRAPLLEAPNELKVFEPETQQSSRVSRGKLESSKIWEWILVPLAQGEIQLPELEFSYFNPASESYETARVQPGLLAVQQGDRLPDEPATARGRIDLQRRDLAFIKLLRGPLRQETRRAHETPIFLALAALPVLWVPVLIAVGRKRARYQRDHGLLRSRKARQRARKRIQTTRKRMDQLDSAAFHEQVARSLVEYVADRFDRSAAGLTYDLADELLRSKQVSGDLRRRFRKVLETCDYARFVPAAGDSVRRGEVLEEATGVVDALERAL